MSESLLTGIKIGVEIKCCKFISEFSEFFSKRLPRRLRKSICSSSSS